MTLNDFFNILSLIEPNGLLALFVFSVGCLLLIGLFLGGRDPGIRSMMGLGTAHCRVSAAILVSAQNFPVRTASPLYWWRLSACCRRPSAWGARSLPQPTKKGR